MPKDPSRDKTTIDPRDRRESVTRLEGPARMRPTRWVPAQASENFAALLERLRTSSVDAVEGELTYERLLGEGGMGVVWLATQRALSRRVAVKTLRDGMREPRAVDALLQEAWLTGALEHPNVVPVHSVGCAKDGAPYIVLKRIEGVRWADVLRSPEVARERFGAQDLLDWHLRVFVQVCNAVSFAHSRGILHRDLKPGNVMLGSFGEVYVLDWGIAVSLRAEDHGRFPLAVDANELAGTPGYMAPEMYACEGRRLAERTDVYQLGAVLWEVFTGAPPPAPDDVDRGPSALPPLLEDAPPALRRIVARATAMDPAERFPSVDSLRAEVLEFLEHRGSAAISQEANAQLAALLAELDAHHGEPHERRERLYRRYGECRFGFRHALRSWPQNEDARAGIERATAAMVEFELAEGSHVAAAGLLAELSSPPPELTARVERARHDADDEARRVEGLRALSRDMDPQIARRTRANIGVFLCAGWTIGPLFADTWDRWPTGEPSHHVPFLAVGATLLVAIGFVIWARVEMLRTAVNRWAAGAVVFGLAASLLLRFGAVLADVPARRATLTDFAIWFLVNGILAIVLQRRLWFAAVAQLGAFYVAAAYPEHLYHAMAAANGVLTVTVFVAWPSSVPAMPGVGRKTG
jgi:serine/threonine-protein kinase